MSPGEVVMFINCKSLYAKWFYGQLGIVESFVPYGADGYSHCKVRWLNPVKYGDGFATCSNFRADNFTKEWIDA